jgi:hypothetical protein
MPIRTIPDRRVISLSAIYFEILYERRDSRRSTSCRVSELWRGRTATEGTGPTGRVSLLPDLQGGLPGAARRPDLNSETAAPMKRDWYVTIVLAIEGAVLLATAVWVYATFYSH